MYTIISPAKSQDFSRDFSSISGPGHAPKYTAQTEQLACILKEKSAEEIASLMSISPALAELNFNRFQSWNPSYACREQAKDGQYNFSPALFAFTGEVYRGFNLKAYTSSDFEYAQKHLGMVSGFYGLLAPLDYIQPYRLEMGTRLSFELEGKAYANLYEYWRGLLTEHMIAILNEEGVLLNLASVEYSKVFDRKQLLGKVLDIDFKIEKNGALKTIAIFAKRARGQMANWIVQDRIDTPEDVKQFQTDAWRYSPENSCSDRWVFVKKN